jgi:hypothetical protein
MKFFGSRVLIAILSGLAIGFVLVTIGQTATHLYGQFRPASMEPAKGEAISRDRTLPQTPGWFEIPNTKLASICPAIAIIQGVEGCGAVMADWGGGLADTKRNRLVIWGGGHQGYFGNEFYALDLEHLKIERLTEPSSGDALSNLKACPESYLDGTPNSRHSYNGLQYASRDDRYFVFGAGVAPCGFFSNFAWIFNPSSTTWVRTSSTHHPNAAQNGSVPLTAYDPVTSAIFEVEANAGQFWRYDFSSDDWKNVASTSVCGALGTTSAIDPTRRLYFCVGAGNFSRIALSGSHTAKNLKGDGCSDLVSASAPGFDFDSSQRMMVGWAGGDTLYIYNPDTDSCFTEHFDGGPGKPQKNGTFGRFRYFPGLGIFALWNDRNENAYVVRLALHSEH